MVSLKHDLLSSTIQPLFSILKQQQFLIAYSGGLDSHVLLHMMSRLPNLQLRAIYIDHGLQDASVWWGRHCRDVCTELNIPFEQVALNLQVPADQSVEAYARDKRYQVFREMLEPDEVLLTAHHQNDQAETLLIQLLRGAGSAGLAAMPMMASFASGSHMRPLLNTSRDQLEQYATSHRLSYVEDTSNADTRYDRNYLRHNILPQLHERWPGCYQTLSRAALLQGETHRLLESYVSQDLASMAGSVEGTLSVASLVACEPVRRRALLRQWFTESGFMLPSAKKLQHIILDVLFSAEDAMPCVHWQGAEVRRFQGDIYVMLPLSAHDVAQVHYWDLDEVLAIDSLGLVLKPEHLGEAWLNKIEDDELNDGLTVRFRQGGEVMHPAGNHKAIPLKQLFQQFRVPPWLRTRIPLLYLGGELIMIYGLCQVEI